MEEYMESEFSGIFRVKLVTKNIERGSPWTQFMHMRVNINNVVVKIISSIFNIYFFLLLPFLMLSKLLLL